MYIFRHIIALLLIANVVVNGRKHHLNLEDDERRLIHISTFGFFKWGSLEVNIHKFFVKPPATGTQLVGFTVDRTVNNGINPYSHNMDDSCPNVDIRSEEGIASIHIIMDFENKVANIDCSTELQSHVKVCRSNACVPRNPMSMTSVSNAMTTMRRRRRSIIPGSIDGAPLDNPQAANKEEKNPLDETPVQVKKEGREGIIQESLSELSKEDQKVSKESKVGGGGGNGPMSNSQQIQSADDKDRSCSGKKFPLNVTTLADGTLSYALTFVVYIAGEDCEGLYSLYFHNCVENQDSRVTLNMSIIEENQNAEDGHNYLSAGEIPLPALYFMMSVLFFMAGCFWVVIIRKSRRENGMSVFKIHYLMGSLVFVKSLSLLFHSINFHYIQVFGTHVEGWAIMFYVAHLLKGALLFLTILLIGTGYAFVKHLLSDKEKKLFMIVIPLQVLANVAQIIIEESEEGEVVHTTWKVIFISVDLLCCGAILFPVVWSIRHLQEASQTDGKAATNLRKLKLFRHFYIMVVCYIYFTRIIVQMLLRITVPFQYEWVDDMFLELTTFIFFVLTGYKFRPTANNPYLELAHDSDEEADMDTAITESGLTEGIVSKRFKPKKKKTLKEIVLFDPNDDGSDDDEEVLLEKIEKREASHDFD